jgi:hypothetical protein
MLGLLGRAFSTAAAGTAGYTKICTTNEYGRLRRVLIGRVNPDWKLPPFGIDPGNDASVPDDERHLVTGMDQFFTAEELESCAAE